MTRQHRRASLIAVSLLAVLIVGTLLSSAIEKVRDAADRMQ